MTQTNPTTHTAAQLAALAPRELNRLAAAILPAVDIDWRDDDDLLVSDDDAQLVPAKTPYVLDVDFRDNFVRFRPTFDLNHAALLEAELARRGLDDAYVIAVEDVLYNRPVEIKAAVDVTNPYLKPLLWLTLTAKQRTIAAILAIPATQGDATCAS